MERKFIVTIELRRLERLYNYRDEAMLDIKANKLYLEDLAISIPMAENDAKLPRKEIAVMHGFPIDE